MDVAAATLLQSSTEAYQFGISGPFSTPPVLAFRWFSLAYLFKTQDFNFDLLKQMILIVDDRIRSVIEKDTNDNQLKRDARFIYRNAIALSLVLVVVWPLPLYFLRICILIVVYPF